jgi:hypothetical protein
MTDLYNLLIIVGILAAQYLLSTRNNVLWGAIIPLAYIAFSTWMFVTDRYESVLSYTLYLLLGLIFLISEWSVGRKSLQQKRNKELMKMRMQDIK